MKFGLRQQPLHFNISNLDRLTTKVDKLRFGFYIVGPDTIRRIFLTKSIKSEFFLQLKDITR